MFRNFAFNENDDLNELEIYTDFPDLVSIEGEDTTSDDSPNPTTTMSPDTGTPSLPPVNTAKTHLSQDQCERGERILTTGK